MNPKALITGATGYIGTKLCQRLLAEDWQVDVLIRENSRSLPPALAVNAITHVYDGSTQSVQDAVAAACPDVVFHLASLFIAEHRSQQVTDLINSNLLFATQLAEACARAGVKRFINTGTSWQHYRSDAYDPVSLYAATKQAFEDILDYYANAFSMRVITLKLFDTYGPDDPRPKLIPFLNKAAKSNEPLDMTAGEQLIDLVHIDDVLEAYVLAAKQLLDGQVFQHENYAVSSGKPMPLKELVHLYAKVTEQTLRVNWGARPYRFREVMVPWSHGKMIPGWTPKVSLFEGLRTVANRHDKKSA